MKAVVDRIVQYANRYRLTNVETGEVLGTFDFDEVTGTVQQVGTEIDKELFDSISADITAEAQARAQADTKETEARTAADNTLQSNINKEAQTRAAADTTLQGNIDAEKAARETAVKAVNDKADAHIARVDNPHAVTKAQVGLGNVNNTSDANKPVSTAQAAAIADAKQAGTYAQQLANAHIARTDNPHSVTKAQVGLGNVDNTSDINKPVSTLQAKAIADAKKAGTDAQNTANAHIANKSNPHAVTKAQIGLENVDNTSDEDKPVSTAQAAAINAKYTKPSTGIPKTDLSQSVQNSIDKAENAATSADLNALQETVNNNSESVENIVNNTTKIAETNFGGFSAGENSSATTGGGAVGSDASTLSGGAVGSGANSTTGGAVGSGAYTTTGFAGGYMAKAPAKGALQLGTGTNNSPDTLQFRQYQLLDSEGVIPSDRLKNAALKKTWDGLSQYTYSGSGSLPNNILYPTMAFADCEYREIIGADFNDIINNGHYVIRTNSTHVAAHAPINGSASTATNGVWHLIVLRYTNTFIRQIAIDVRNGTNAIQVRNNLDNSWGEWQSLLYTNNSVTRLMTYTTSSLSGNRTLSGAYYNYAFIIVRYYPSGADYWVEDIIPVDYLAEYPGTSSAHRVLTTQTTNGWCNYWFSSGTTFNWKAGDMYRVEVYAY